MKEEGLMLLLYPTVSLRRVQEVTPALLRRLGVEALILDVDNTLSSPGSQTPAPGTQEWARALQRAGVRLVILSNNRKKRVEPFAAQYGLPCLSRGCKPLPFGYWRAQALLGVPASRIAVVGDQVFTDVLGAGLCGMRSVLLEPVSQESGVTFRVRRVLERCVRSKFPPGAGVEKG